MPPDVVCIIGPDGAGKTTQVRILIERLEERDVSTQYMWLGFTHVLSLPVLAIARVLGLSETVDVAGGGTVGYHYFWRSNILSTIYPLLLFFDTLLFIVPRIYFYMYFTNSVVVCDRFIYDSLVNVMISVRDYTLHSSRLGRMFLRMIPAGTKTVLLLADSEVLRNRRADVEYDRTLELKVDLYKRLADAYDIPIIDASKSIDSITKEIIATVDDSSNIVEN